MFFHHFLVCKSEAAGGMKGEQKEEEAEEKSDHKIIINISWIIMLNIGISSLFL